MKSIAICCCALITSLCIAESAEAQIRVGPFGGVSVRVPFVSVDVLPFGGGTSVRAPFTRVNTGLYGGYGYGGYRFGGYGYGGPAPVGYVQPVPVYPVPIHPSDHYVARRPYYSYSPYSYSAYTDDRYTVSPPRVTPYRSGYPSYTDEGAYRYQDELGMASDGILVDPSLSVPTPILKPRISGRAERLLESHSIGNATSASGINSPQELDSMYGEPNALMQSAESLQRSLLARGNDGDIWMDYLKPDLVIETIRTRGDANQLAILTRNYDGVADNAELFSISRLPGFRRTRQGLKVWVNRNADPGVTVDSSVTLGSDISVDANTTTDPNTTMQSGPSILSKPADDIDVDVQSSKPEMIEPTPAALPAPANGTVPSPEPDSQTNDAPKATPADEIRQSDDRVDAEKDEEI